VISYLYPFFQHALVKGPFVHAVSLSTSPMSVDGSTAASAKGARPNRQKRLNMEAIAKETKGRCEYTSTNSDQRTTGCLYLISHTYLTGISRARSAPIFQVATPMCGCIWHLQFIDLHRTLESVSILVWVARAVAFNVRMWISGRRQLFNQLYADEMTDYGAPRSACVAYILSQQHRELSTYQRSGTMVVSQHGDCV
jgi:hypothetical protein